MTESLHITHLLSSYIDEVLSSFEREEADTHLITCPTCQEELGLLRTTIAMVSSLPRVEPPSDLLGRTKQRIKESEQSWFRWFRPYYIAERWTRWRFLGLWGEGSWSPQFSKPASKKDTLETFTPTGVNLEFIAELLNGVARAQNPTSYLDAMHARAQARRQIQQVKLIEEYSATMVSILNNTKEAQAAFLEMALLFIDAKYVPLIHEKVRKNQQKLADEGKDPYASSPQTEQSQKQPEPEFIKMGPKPNDPK